MSRRVAPLRRGGPRYCGITCSLHRFHAVSESFGSGCNNVAMRNVFLLSGLLVSLPAAAQTVGPENGALVIVGGGLKDQSVWNRFIELAGGPDAEFVVIPTAGGDEDYSNWPRLARLRSVGLRNLTLLHTYDPKVADSTEFAKPLKTARGVWFSGGRQWRLADSYLGTRVEDELRKLLDRGGVIGGSSAGATIQGSYLARGDTKTNTIMMGDHVEGFGFVKNVAIDQHLLRRNRQFDLLEILSAKPKLLGLGIDEDTAIVVQRDRFEVIGQSYVAVYDSSTDSDFELLPPGTIFDLARRKIVTSKQDR